MTASVMTAKVPAAVGSFNDACDYFQTIYDANPARHGLEALELALDGKQRAYPTLSINHRIEPGDFLPKSEQYPLPKVNITDPEQATLASQVLQMLSPLALLNPVHPVFQLGKGTGTLVPSFGIPLNEALDNTPAYTVEMEELLAQPDPDPATSGILPEIRRTIQTIDALAPSTFRIAYPDMQGPFNLAHAMTGTDAFTAPYEEPELWDEFMTRLTRFWIAVQKNLMEWIPESRRAPLNRFVRIAECSVNMVAADFYRDFILPYDKMIADEFGPLHIHPCSGPHVFHVTLENLPVAATEAGKMIQTVTAAGSISVDEARQALKDRPITLLVGQEIPQGGEFDWLHKDMIISRDNPNIFLCGYTGVHWQCKDREAVRDLHRKLDASWED